MTLRARFALIFLSFILLVLGTFTGTYYFLEQRSEVRRQRLYALATLDKVASVCREANIHSSWISAINHLKVAKGSDASIVFADCLDTGGKAWVHSDPAKIGLLVARPMTAPITDELREKSYQDERGSTIWEIARSIRLGDKIVGMARIGYDAAELERQIQSKLWDTIRRLFLVSSITLAAALAAAFFVAWGLLGPISALVLATRQVKKGNLNYQSAVAGRGDELGELAREFNSMAKHLAELDEIKKIFVESITHDLKGPIGVIEGYVQLLSTAHAGVLHKDQELPLRTIGAQAKHLELYVGNLLDYSKLQVGKLPMKIGPVSVADIVKSIVEAFSVTAELGEVRLEARVQEGLPTVPGDAEMIRRVVGNLVTNALKFTPRAGRVVVESSLEDRFVRVCVKDTGVGIPPEYLERVFEKFFQVQETRAHAQKPGTGLGLSICRQFVEQHGGRIWAQSAPNAGTTLFFTLPVNKS